MISCFKIGRLHSNIFKRLQSLAPQNLGRGKGRVAVSDFTCPEREPRITPPPPPLFSSAPRPKAVAKSQIWERHEESCLASLLASSGKAQGYPWFPSAPPQVPQKEIRATPLSWWPLKELTLNTVGHNSEAAGRVSSGRPTKFARKINTKLTDQK